MEQAFQGMVEPVALPNRIVEWARFSEVGVTPLLGGASKATTLSEQGHRPWPLPDRPWLMAQTWSTLLFAHWPVPHEQLRRLVPAQLPIDTFDGRTWLGITPFLVSGLRLRGTPPVPYVSRFPELNVRTYVTVNGKPGIYFLSLDAARRSAVVAARRFYRLPYFHAQMTHRPMGKETEFHSKRLSTNGPPASFAARYRGAGPISAASPGNLEYFLTERYCLYTLDERQRVMRAEIHHPPWPLQRAEAQIKAIKMTAPLGLDLVGEPLLHLSKRQDVLIWSIESAE